MYVDFIENFLFSDSRELLGVILIWNPQPKNVWFPLSRHVVRRVQENFSDADRATWWHLEPFRPLKAKSVSFYYLDMMYVEFMKNFLPADSSELLAVRLIWLLSLKTFHCYFLDMLYVEFIKSFLPADPSELLLLSSFWPPEPKNVWFLLSTYVVRRVHEKFSSPDSSELLAVRTHFGLLGPKTLIPNF